MKPVQTLTDAVGISFKSFIFLSVATLGIYPLMWLYRNQDSLFDIFEEEAWRLDMPVLIAGITAMTWVIAMCLPFAGSTLLVVGVWFGLWINWAIHMERALMTWLARTWQVQVHIDKRYLCAFHVFYLIWVMEMIPELMRNKASAAQAA